MAFLPLRRKKKLLITLFSLYVVLYALIWAISSPLIKHFIAEPLAQFDLALADKTSIRFNPFMTKLTISDLSLIKQQETKSKEVLAFNQAVARVTLFELLFDKIEIPELQLNQGFIDIVQTDEQITIAGFDIPSSNIDDKQDNKTPTKSAEPAFPYQVILPLFSLTDFTVSLNKQVAANTVSKHTFTVKQLQLSELKATLEQQEAELQITATVDDTALTANAKAELASGHGNITSDIDITNYPINKLSPYIDALSELQGSFSLQSEQVITLSPSKMNIHIKAGKINKDLLHVAFEDKRFTLANFQQDISDLSLTLSQGEITSLTGTSNISLSQGSLQQHDKTQQLLNFESLLVENIALQFKEKPEVHIAQVAVNNIEVSKITQSTNTDLAAANDKPSDKLSSIDNLPPIATLKQLSVNDILVNEDKLILDTITLDSLLGDIIVDQNKVISNLVQLADNSATQANTELASEVTKPNKTDVLTPEKSDTLPEDNRSSNNNFVFQLTKFHLVNTNTFTLIDNSVDPIIERTLHLDKLELGALTNDANNQQATPFSIVGRSNKYANFDLSGQILPFAPTPNYHLEGYLKELSLVALSSYVKDAAKLEVKTGQLSTDINVDLTGDELDGEVSVLLQGLETGIVDSHEAGSLIDQGALPLNMALGMLKDSNGAVELDVPVSGSTSDPQFGLSSIVTLITQKAILSATQDYLIKTFVPYANIVSVAMTAGEFALKLRFDDLPYQIKQVSPDEQQAAYLQEFIALMQNKADTKVTICAISVPEDIGLKAGNEITDKAAIKQLKDLGEQREHAFKDYIIEQGKIDSSRLLLCNPKIDSGEGALPRIALSV